MQPAKATDDRSLVGPVEVVLVAVKGWQVPEVIETMRPLVGPETLVVPLLNGVEAPDQLAAAFGQSRVAGGLCGVLASMAGPGHIRNLAPHPLVTIGELDNAHTARIERLHNALATRAGRFDWLVLQTSVNAVRTNICTRLDHVLRYARQSRARRESFFEEMITL